MPNELETILASMNEEEQRRYLLLLCQLLYNDSGYGVGENLALYLSNMPFENLKKEASVLLEEHTRVLAGKGALVFDRVKEKMDEMEPSSAPDGYSEEEASLVEAAVMYAALQQSPLKMMHAAEVGQIYEVQKHWYQRAWKAVKENALPVLLRLVAVAAVVTALILLVKLVTPAGFLMGLVSRYLEVGLGPFMVLMVMMGLECLYKWLDENLFSTNPLFQRVKDNTEDVQSKLKRHMATLQYKADIFVNTVEEDEEEPVLVPVEEDEEDEEEWGWGEENHPVTAKP